MATYEELAASKASAGGASLSDLAVVASRASRVLAQSAVAVSHTGDTLETTKATVVIPANTIGPNGRLRITSMWSHTNSANNKTERVKFGASAYQSVTVTTTATTRQEIEIANRGAANSQVGGLSGGTGGWGSSANALITSAIDTATDVPLTFTAQLALGSETITLEGYIVELLP